MKNIKDKAEKEIKEVIDKIHERKVDALRRL
jgi:hypothetical protein